MSTDSIDRYRRLFETLSPTSLESLDRYFTPDARFADPFSDVRGVDSIRRIFAHMFERTPDARFTVHECIGNNPLWYLRWQMDFRARNGEYWCIEGVSRVMLSEDGRVAEHLDFWDAAGQLYERLPLLGPVIRAIRRRIG